MRSQVRHAIVGVVLLAAVATGRANAQNWDLGDLRAFSGLTADQWKAVDSGNSQAKVLDTSEKREVAIVGVAHLQATSACFVAQLQDIENFKKNPAVLRVRKFGRTVAPRDLKEFSLETGDLAGLRNCRVGDCNVKLPIAAVKRLGRDIDWSRPDYATASLSVFREELLAYLESYLDGGNSALFEYRDKNKPVRLADEFLAVLDAWPGLSGLAPEFHDYLAHYPSEPLPGVSEFFYWSTESFGLKPVASITHVSIYVQPGRAVVASKQIYASHYFDASLGLTAALDDPGKASARGMYLVYVNRSRIDFLSGFFGGLRRALARGRLRDGMRKNLAEAVRKLESSCAEYPKDIPDALSFDQLSLDFAERF
jgi:hypothetical protein